MQVTLNTHKHTTFTAHGARNINQMMERLYKSAYQNELFEHCPDVIEISARMSDGKEVSALACFNGGIYTGLSFPYETAHYRKEFSKAILNRYNQSVTKGKYRK